LAGGVGFVALGFWAAWAAQDWFFLNFKFRAREIERKINNGIHHWTNFIHFGKWLDSRFFRGGCLIVAWVEKQGVSNAGILYCVCCFGSCCGLNCLAFVLDGIKFRAREICTQLPRWVER
jgi:hypothetical protein